MTKNSVATGDTRSGDASAGLPQLDPPPSLVGSIEPLPEVARVVVLMPSWVGDITMATPLLRAIREARPRATVAALLRPGLSDILSGTPWLNEIIEAPMRGWAGPWSGLARARGFGADTALLLPNSMRSGLAALRLAPRRVGYSTQLRRWTLTDPLPAPARRRPTPAVDFYAALGEALLGTSISDRRTQLFTSPEEEQAADGLLGDLRSFILLNPGANREDKRWPAERFASLGIKLLREFGTARGKGIAVTGAPAERALVARVAALIQAEAGNDAVIDLCSRGMALGPLKAVVRRASLLVTNDTGPRHLAAALGTPSVVFFGPTDHRWTTLPEEQSERDRLLVAEPFLPEPLQADDFVAVCRIDRISIEDALHAARRILERA
ncbi:MAG: glycosyltransferase family 9 protein [Phycisphaeraceae bacterium]|nr:glycosyltransferase family 9 protein [Phycisphaeraceae bacterium]